MLLTNVYRFISQIVHSFKNGLTIKLYWKRIVFGTTKMCVLSAFFTSTRFLCSLMLSFFFVKQPSPFEESMWFDRLIIWISACFPSNSDNSMNCMFLLRFVICFMWIQNRNQFHNVILQSYWEFSHCLKLLVVTDL